MRPPIPQILDYGIHPDCGFLPPEFPLERLPDPYYEQWERVAANLQPLLLSKRLRSVVQRLPVLSTARLLTPPQWRRAYVILAFLTHAYIWGGDQPEERIPPSISIPFLQACQHLELPPVATYAGVCLWNYKPIFESEPIDDLGNLYTLLTFTGSLDESWFYLVSVAIEARGAPMIPLMLDAIEAARVGDTQFVKEALMAFAQRIDEIGSLLMRMNENCDPHVFYHKIRPFLAGSKNMAEAGLPNGVIFEDGSGIEPYRQYGGGSNAQSSLIQFFDLVLGVEHRPTGQPKKSSAEDDTVTNGHAPPVQHNFIHDMRSYMPGPHRRFLEHVASVANIRDFVMENRHDRALTIAYDACCAMLRTLRDKHIQLVSRFIILKSRETRSKSQSLPADQAAAATAPLKKATNLASASSNTSSTNKKSLRGTGGTALIPFLKQARDETGEPAIDGWARRILGNTGATDRPLSTKSTQKHSLSDFSTTAENKPQEVAIVGLAGTWKMDDSEGGLCHW